MSVAKGDHLYPVRASWRRCKTADAILRGTFIERARMAADELHRASPQSQFFPPAASRSWRCLSSAFVNLIDSTWNVVRRGKRPSSARIALTQQTMILRGMLDVIHETLRDMRSAYDRGW